MSELIPVRHRGHGQKLTRLQDSAISALLTHGQVKSAAKSIGIRPETLNRWMGLPAFAEAYARARRESLEETIGLLRMASREAVETLMRNLHCGLPAVEIAAAKVILDSVLKPSGVQVDGGQSPVKIEIVYAPSMTFDAREGEQAVIDVSQDN